jgi:hypothetical protein
MDRYALGSKTTWAFVISFRPSTGSGQRHAYGYTLRWSKMRWKAENLSDTLTTLRDQLRVFFEAMS